MLAVVVHGAGDLRLEEREPVEPGPGEVQLAVAYVGICGSDLHYYRNGRVGAFEVVEPLVVGHEMSGTVVRDGDGVLAPGTPVTLHPATPGTPEPAILDRPSIWPGSRYLGSAATLPHTQGAAQSLVTVRTDQVRVLPDGLGLRTAALAEPLGVGLHAIRRAGGVAGRRVLVSGAGPVGLLAAGAAVALGAEVTVSDVLAHPLGLALRLGVDSVVDLTSAEPTPEGYDVVLECAGVPAALDTAVRSVRRGGVVVAVGMLPAQARPYTLAALVAREIDLRGSFRFDDEIDQAVELLAAHPSLASVVTDVFPAREAVAAFDRAVDPAVSSKVLLDLRAEEGPA
ncbi:L-idonate 5-dehydrogenase [Salana multivorans]|uniref:L-idonate 5-dehydrogenase n=1 Tax=Salana multivorans TaxID=120377 RepID=A0A3N2DD92_9MICO|nr:zinc-binding dehydrogenase [Salana multivorans]ROR97743.1 L-idonate 5-dehydrogenase [Salana multivorans]